MRPPPSLEIAQGFEAGAPLSGHDEAPSDRIIDALVSRVRGKIETNPKKPEIITTISGVGYKLNASAIEQS